MKTEKSDDKNKFKIEKKRKKEQYVVAQMISLYCRKNHKEEWRLNGKKECDKCKQLEEYAQMRSEKCPFMEHKTFCANCKIHCYKPEMRQEIKKVMRFSGPRMIMYHPILAMWHLITSKREKSKKELKIGNRE